MSDLFTRLQAALGDHYTVERELAAGGMGRVFVALERGLERRVAVKVLKPDLAAAVSVERFRREIQLAASLQHPHIVPLLAAGEADGLLYYTMPFIDGETLRARLARDGRLRVPDVVRILRDVLDALAYAHRRGVVHRDIKPENILLVDDHALVTDFGVAKALTQATGGSGLTTAGVTLGTPAYMAPEQAAGDPGVDHRSDVYAAGVVAYEMLGGEPPFTGMAQRVLAAQVTERPRSVARIRADLAPALVSGVMRCLEKDPADRWQSADDLKRELDSAATGGPASGTIGGRRRWRTAVVVLLGAAGLVAGWAAWRAGAHPGGVASPALVAVLPFSVQGSAEIAYLGQGMVNLLSTSLDGAGDLRAVDPHAVLSVVQRGGIAVLDPTRAAAVAERLGAGRYVLGDVVEAGGRVQIGASLYDRARGPSPVARGTVEGSAGQVFSLVDGLATQLLSQTSSGPTGRVTRVASVTTPSLAAYKAYLDGDAAFRAGRADSAVASFQRAINIDTAFALAYYRLSVAAEWATRAALAEHSAEQAVRHSARLADHDRMLLRALLAVRRGAAVEAEGQYRSILGIYPDDIEAWTQLGEVLFHYGPTLGRAVAESRGPFERVLYFEPGYVSAMLHLARIAALERRSGAVDSLVAAILRLSPSSDRDLEMKALRAYAVGDVKAQKELRADVARASESLLFLPVWDVSVYVGDLDGAAVFASAFGDPGRSRDAQGAGHATLAYLALAGGKVADARAEVQRTSAADSVRALEYGTLLELAPFADARRATLDAARRALRRLDAGAVPASAQPAVYFNAHDGVHTELRDYLLGVVSVRLGDFAGAERYAAALAQRQGPPTAATLPRDLALEVRAELALARRAPETALALLRQRKGESWYEYHFASPFFSGSRARYLRASLEAAAAKGEDDVRRAITLFSAFEGYSAFDLIYAAPSHLRRAVLYERLGDRAAAAAHYTRFLTLWKDADAEFRPLLDSARAGYERATSSR